ncbi:MAG: ABC transporter ATP-binding protein [Deltaproteobacteria bacterium]|nr:ABC transporter ATP-binding protein [Deltaproteobacteria bacterium]
MNPVLEISQLQTFFETRYGTVRAVDGVTLSLDGAETLGIVGESGCGKTVLALSIMRLVPSPPGRIVSGSVLLNGTDLLRLSEDKMRAIRGGEISMIFQEPMNSLNPVIRIGDQMTEAIRLHQGLSRRDALERAREMLELVGMPSAGDRLRSYPHQMSGGMRQRVMIAMALSCNPRLMLADEPTTALDVTIQAQILELINRIKSERGASVILITHDLGVIAEAAQFAAVMYTGKVVEYCAVDQLFNAPLHPYTEGLIASTPDPGKKSRREARLHTIPGTVPSLYHLPRGCSFQDRCPSVMDICRQEEPDLTEEGAHHRVRCWKYR